MRAGWPRSISRRISPEHLFDAPALSDRPARASYDVAADGQRFIAVTRSADRAPRRVYVISDLFAVLRGLFAE